MDLFEYGEWNEGKRKRDQGKAKVAAHNQEWLRDIRREAARISAINGSVSAADLRQWCYEHDRWPDHDNAWGSVFKGKQWVHTGAYVPCRHRDGHARDVKVWTYVSTVYR